MAKKDLKLTIELIPESAWGENLRKYLPKEIWEKIRKEVFRKANYKCSICGKRGKLHCHEVWEYDDQNHILKLKGFMALCENCHLIKHWGMATILASEGKIKLEDLIKHFMEVNNCDRLTFEEHKKEAIQKFNERSRHEWLIDISILKGERD
jgi:hypothetical protein